MMHHVRQAVRTAARTFDVRGRAPRTEFLGYVVLSQVPLVVVRQAAEWFAPAGMADALALATLVIVTAPLFALAIRRCHDAGRSGWWSAPLLALVARSLLLDLIGIAAGWPLRSGIEGVLSYLDWLLTIPATTVGVAMVAWPGSKGTNRLGPGPDLSQHDTAKAGTAAGYPDAA